MSPTVLSKRLNDSVTKDALRAYLAEFISTFFFVLAAVGSSMASRRLMPDVAANPSSLMIVGLANAFALSSTVYIAANVSGGHVNPAVTFAKAVCGHLSAVMALFYWFSQMVASVMACLFLRTVTADQQIPTYQIAEEMTGFGASLLEGVLTFALVYTVYSAGDPRRGPLGFTGPLAIGMMVGVIVMAAGPFSGGSMNPACAFGSAIVAGNFKNQAAYWVGPLIGGAVAGLVYDNLMFPVQPTDSNSMRGGLEGNGV